MKVPFWQWKTQEEIVTGKLFGILEKHNNYQHKTPNNTKQGGTIGLNIRMSKTFEVYTKEAPRWRVQKYNKRQISRKSHMNRITVTVVAGTKKILCSKNAKGWLIHQNYKLGIVLRGFTTFNRTFTETDIVDSKRASNKVKTELMVTFQEYRYVAASTCNRAQQWFSRTITCKPIKMHVPAIRNLMNSSLC